MREVPVEAPVPESVPLDEALAEHRVFRPAAGKGFDVERVDDGVFRVTRRAGGSACWRATTWTTTRRSPTSRDGCSTWA